MTTMGKRQIIHITFVCYMVLCMLMVSCNSASRREMMSKLLTQAEKKNAEYVSLATDSVMKDVLDFYTKHGNIDEQARANYMMGCVYRDRNDAPRALNYYKEAVLLAENDKLYIDNQRLSRIYGQIAELYHHQSTPLMEREAER